MNTLNKYSLPDERYFMKKEEGTGFIYDNQYIHLFFYKKLGRIRRKKLANLNFLFDTTQRRQPSFELKIDFKDLSFLDICGGTILELNENFEKEGKLEEYKPIIYHNIEGS